VVEARPTAQLDRAREVLLAWFTPLVTPADLVPAAEPAKADAAKSQPPAAAPAPAPSPATGADE
jgi:hypothetical protein